MADARRPGGTYQVITQPNALKQRLGTGAGIDSRLTDQANEAVDRLHAAFRQRVGAAVGEIRGELARVGREPAQSAPAMDAIQLVARDLQLQAAAFDWPLISDVCTSLRSYLDACGATRHLDRAVVGAHADVLQRVVDRAIAGDGGYEGVALIERLNKAVAAGRV